MSDNQINGDMTERAVSHTAALEWSPSPSGSVYRKRVHLVGPPEAGQVTSVVRYAPASTFPRHDHPDGEEILVLDGVFSDEHGDWKAGTYLLNPEGFTHEPFSTPGCLLFVKLRQYPGTNREHLVIQTHDMEWEQTATDGVSQKLLYEQDGFTDVVRLEKWRAGTRIGKRLYPKGAELFVLDGQFEDEKGTYGSGSWLRLPQGTSHSPRTERGCELYVKEGGLPYLESINPRSR